MYNDNSNKMQIEQRWVIPQTTFRAKELETKSTTRKQENLKNDHCIVRFRPIIDLKRRRETHAECTNNKHCVRKRPTEY